MLQLPLFVQLESTNKNKQKTNGVTPPKFVRQTLRVANLDLNHFMLPHIVHQGQVAEDQVEWRVVAVVCHRGESPLQGHYYTWRRHAANAFVKMDDTRCCEEQYFTTLSDIPFAYLLFLEPR